MEKTINFQTLDRDLNATGGKVSLMDKLVDELLEKETLEAEFVIDTVKSRL